MPFRTKRHNSSRFYPKAQYALGMHAWLQQQPERAAGFFRQAVSQDVLHLDAWLRLAETEAALGSEEKAKDILTFTDRFDGAGVSLEVVTDGAGP